jgi:hypothetical protein
MGGTRKPSHGSPSCAPLRRSSAAPTRRCGGACGCCCGTGPPRTTGTPPSSCRVGAPPPLPGRCMPAPCPMPPPSPSLLDEARAGGRAPPLPPPPPLAHSEHTSMTSPPSPPSPPSLPCPALLPPDRRASCRTPSHCFDSATNPSRSRRIGELCPPESRRAGGCTRERRYEAPCGRPSRTCSAF